MTDITLVRQNPEHIPPADAEAARRVLFGIVDGLGELGRKRWRRFINGLLRLEPGEMVQIQTAKARSGPFHRRHMKMEQVIFEAQERFDSFKQFRDWLKVGSGHCDWIPGPKGAVIPIPKSISYASMEDDEMREFHDAAMAFLRQDHAGRVLWPHLNAAHRAEAIEGILMGFGE